MAWQTAEALLISVAGMGLEARCYGPAPSKAPTIVLLHEGLGSVSLWRDFPERLANATGHGVFAYSRAGYGSSEPAELPRPIDYMQREATVVLPQMLDAIGWKQGVLLGHSDGASIAAYYAGSRQDNRVRGLCLIAPHFFAEPDGLGSIAEARRAYQQGELRDRLARHHHHVDNAFFGWNDAWLDPAFANWNIEEAIGYIRVPVLAIQGEADQYGSVAQIEALEAGLYSPLDTLIVQDCRHAPHLEKPDQTLAAISEYIARLGQNERAGRQVAQNWRVDGRR